MRCFQYGYDIDSEYSKRKGAFMWPLKVCTLSITIWWQPWDEGVLGEGIRARPINGIGRSSNPGQQQSDNILNVEYYKVP